MGLITIPPGIREVKWTPPTLAEYVVKSGYSGKATVLNRGGVTAGWRAEVSVAPRSKADMLAWKVFAMQARSKANVFRVPAVQPGLQAAAPVTLRPFPFLAGQVSNRAIYNDNLTNAAWVQTRLTSITVSNIPAPDGATNKAFFASESTANGAHAISQNIAGTAGVYYVFSIWARKATRRYVLIGIDGTSNAVIDLDTGLVVDSSAGVAAGAIADDFGWYRCWVAASTAGSTSASAAWGDTGTIAAIQAGYAGTVGSGMYFYRPQLETGRRPTPIVVTQGSLVVSRQAVALDNLTASQTILKAGSMVSLYDRLYALTGDLVTDAVGRGTMALTPPLASLTAADTVIFAQAPFGRMRMATEDGGWADKLGYGQPADFTCEEAL